MKKKNVKWRRCRGCGRYTTKLFIIADDMENPKPYHKKCADELVLKTMIKYNEEK